MNIARTDIRMTSTGFTIANSALNYLAGLPQKNRLELRSIGHFTDRYSPVSTINGTTATMTQPAWNNNLWGYDTMQAPIFGGHGLSIENSLSFISQAGHWYIDPAAGRLYLKPANGVNPSSLDVQLPRLERLIGISGSYDNPVRNLSFEGLQFSGTSWLAPSGPNGYAVQQTGAYLAGSYSYYPPTPSRAAPRAAPRSSGPGRPGTSRRRPSRSRRRQGSPSSATRSSTSARRRSGSATTPTRTPPASASARATST